MATKTRFGLLSWANTEQNYGCTYIGLKPEEPREEDWLNVANLHELDGMLTHKPIELYYEIIGRLIPPGKGIL